MKKIIMIVFTINISLFACLCSGKIKKSVKDVEEKVIKKHETIQKILKDSSLSVQNRKKIAQKEIEFLNEEIVLNNLKTTELIQILLEIEKEKKFLTNKINEDLLND